ncbi:putative membrane protein [Xenococcus sp. PCC 7305]|uniref:vitamin K epoxide reductase family protein n=1 Tax=Xenococcus sp. PCC 7305 TaxID=102125 RepID=UPI0002ACC8CA|nr:vitamin K epoxide reductase family protein [Xenococcus sp. PCC 7305]ELS00459.1 putative membrane protein [Xenococcus sp. PCC 7305]
MRRKRSLPLIYRLSRPLIGAIAIAGAVLTAYLTFTKLFGGEVVCTAEGTAGSCGDVLNGPYGTVFGQPLSLFGCLAYLSMAVFALAPLLINPEQNKSLRKNLENWTWLLLLAGSTAMAVFSGYLMYLLAFKIQTLCFYCIGSALFALSMFVLTLIGRDWEDIGQIFFTGVIVAMLTLVGALGVYANVNNPIVETPDADGLIKITRPQTSPEPPKGWEITTISGESEIELAEYLTAIGAKKYGAFWCPHCFEQKQLFGKEAFSEIDYIECADLENPRAQSAACKEAQITSYPTWEINDELYQGTKVLSELAEISGYEGTAEFKYKM